MQRYEEILVYPKDLDKIKHFLATKVCAPLEICKYDKFLIE